MELMLQPLRKYADFQGRARRQEYWLFVLGVFVAEVVGSVIIDLAGGGAGNFSFVSGVLAILFGVALLGVIVPSIAVAFRRLHDTNRSAWWLLIAFLPLIGSVVLLIFYCLDGTPGPNRFGQDPKGRNLTDASVFS